METRWAELLDDQPPLAICHNLGEGDKYDVREETSKYGVFNVIEPVGIAEYLTVHVWLSWPTSSARVSANVSLQLRKSLVLGSQVHSQGSFSQGLPHM